MLRRAALFLACFVFLSWSPRSVYSQIMPEDHFVSVNGFEMHYQTMGAGEPLLLVHGWSGNTDYFNPLLQPLAEEYQLIIPDLRGHGRSTNPSGEFTMGQAASDLIALLDILELDGVRAMGASAGGLILLHIGTREPSRLSSMIIVGAGSRFLPHCRASMAATNADEYPETWWNLMRARHAFGDDQIRAIVEYLRSFAGNDTDVDFTPDELSRIEARTFIVHGDRDWCFPPSLPAEIFEAIPDAALWVIPGGEHVPILGEHAQEFLSMALTFFEAG